ncbi:MAG: hypothetical protein WB870_09825 [Gallionellaceae bacterium]
MPPLVPEGFNHFVTSIAAPVASGWSGCRVGFAPTGKAPPYHGAHPFETVTVAKRGQLRLRLFTSGTINKFNKWFFKKRLFVVFASPKSNS